MREGENNSFSLPVNMSVEHVTEDISPVSVNPDVTPDRSPRPGTVPQNQLPTSPDAQRPVSSCAVSNDEKDRETPPALGFYPGFLGWPTGPPLTSSAAASVLKVLAGYHQNGPIAVQRPQVPGFRPTCTVGSPGGRGTVLMQPPNDVRRGVPIKPSMGVHSSGSVGFPHQHLGAPARGSRRNTARAARRQAASATCSERIQQASPGSVPDLEELERFAVDFKKRRTALGYTQWNVGNTIGRISVGVDFSQTTISRFEALNLSYSNMLKLKPLLERWLEEMEGQCIKEPPRSLPRPESVDTPEIKDQETDNNGNLIAVQRCSPDDGGTSPFKPRKRRSIITDELKCRLEQIYAAQPRPTPTQLALISEWMDMERDTVRVWFCNRRSRDRQKRKGEQQLLPSSDRGFSNECNISSNLREPSSALPCVPPATRLTATGASFTGLFPQHLLGFPFASLSLARAGQLPIAAPHHMSDKAKRSEYFSLSGLAQGSADSQGDASSSPYVPLLTSEEPSPEGPTAAKVLCVQEEEMGEGPSQVKENAKNDEHDDNQMKDIPMKEEGQSISMQSSHVAHEDRAPVHSEHADALSSRRKRRKPTFTRRIAPTL